MMRAVKTLRGVSEACAANPGGGEGGRTAARALGPALPRRIKSLVLALVAVLTFALVGLACLHVLGSA